MIQFEISPPETGPPTPQGLRDSQSEKTGEEPTEFSQVWSEQIADDASKVVTPSFAQPPDATNNDTASAEVPSDAEATEVQPELHVEEIELTAWASASTAYPSNEIEQALPANEHPIPRARQLSATTLVPDRNSIPEQTDSNVAQTSSVGVQPGSPTEVTETTVQTLPITSPGGSFNRLPTFNPTPEAVAFPPESATLQHGAAGASPAIPTTSETGNLGGQFQSKPLGEGAGLPTATQAQDNKAPPLPTSAVRNQAKQTPALATTSTAQILPSAGTPTPVQAVDKQQRTPPISALPLKEASSAAQSDANPSPTIPVKMTSPTIPTVPLGEPIVPMSPMAPEAELAAAQPQHTSAASASTTVVSAQQSHAPHVASQIIAAVSQSSGSSTEILLSPEELGRVRISLTNGDAGITVSILTERAETAELMRRNIELLARDLRDMGYENPSFTFGERPDGSDDAWDDTHPESPSEDPNIAPEPPTSSMHVTLTGGLDLKL